MSQINMAVDLSGEDSEVRRKVQEINQENGGTKIDFVSEPHVACCLLVDTSGSMSGEKIAQLNDALKMFRPAVCEDPLSARRVDVCLVEFNTKVKVVSTFCPITQFNPPELKAFGGTSMGAGIRYALELVHDQVQNYHKAGVECYKPFVLMITDGCPTDNVIGIEKVIAERESSGKYGHLRFHAFGVKGADMKLLARLTHRTLAITDNAFDEIFNWASKSMQIISNSQPSMNVPGAGITGNMHPYEPTQPLPWSD